VITRSSWRRSRPVTGRAVTLAAAHLTATRRSTLATSKRATIQANLVGGIDLSAAL